MAGGGGGSGYVASSVLFGNTFTGDHQSPACSWDNDLPKTTDTLLGSSKYGYGGEPVISASQYTSAYGGSGYCVIYY